MSSCFLVNIKDSKRPKFVLLTSQIFKILEPSKNWS